MSQKYPFIVRVLCVWLGIHKPITGWKGRDTWEYMGYYHAVCARCLTVVHKRMPGHRKVEGWRG